jgi:hypothetical protein
MNKKQKIGIREEITIMTKWWISKKSRRITIISKKLKIESI